MTGGQRRTHVVLWLVLGPLVLIGLFLAVARRPAEPVQAGPLPGIESNGDNTTAGGGVTP